MKALTICQPYADLIASGEKWIENRTWPTSYRGALAIHAGKSRDWLMPDDDTTGMAFGAVVAVAELVDCRRLADLTDEQRAHEHAEGPWCFVLGNIRRLDTPVPVRGAQGLWEWTPAQGRRTAAVNDLPSIEEMAGSVSDVTGGQTLKDFMRWLRGE